MRMSALAIIALAAGPASRANVDAVQRSAPQTAPAQSAYAAIGEIVRILKADSTTDWSKVDLEAVTTAYDRHG